MTWGAPKLHGELLERGIVISERRVFASVDFLS